MTVLFWPGRHLGRSAKYATAPAAPPSENLHVRRRPAHAPRPQETNREPRAAVAVRSTDDPRANAVLHVGGQRMPAGELLTTP